MADEISNLKSQLADMTAKNTALGEQLKNALEGKVDDIKEFMANLSIQDEATAKIRELTTQNENLQGIVNELQEKVQALTGMAGGAQGLGGVLLGGASTGAAGTAEGALGNVADQASDAADAATEQAAEAAAEAQKKAEQAAAEAQKAAEEAAEEAQEKAEEAAAAAASAVGSITSGFGW